MKPIQAGGLLQTWRSPLDKTYQRPFLRLDPSSEPDPRAGVVIISDQSHQPLLVAAVKNMRKELPSLMGPYKGSQLIVYWLPQRDENEGKNIVRNLTDKPEFVG